MADGSEGKASACNVGDPGSIPGSGWFPWWREWQLTPVFLPGESHGLGSLVGYSPQAHRVGYDWATSLSGSVSLCVSGCGAAVRVASTDFWGLPSSPSSSSPCLLSLPYPPPHPSSEKLPKPGLCPHGSGPACCLPLQARPHGGRSGFCGRHTGTQGTCPSPGGSVMSWDAETESHVLAERRRPKSRPSPSKRARDGRQGPRERVSEGCGENGPI